MNNYNKNNGVYSKKIRAGKRRTYFFDVRTTRSNDYYLTITESKKRFDNNGYERHKLHLYKEDFNKFIDALQETVDYVKEDLMPEYNFDEYNFDRERDNGGYSDNYNDKVNDNNDQSYTNELMDDVKEPADSDDDDLRWD